MCLKLSFSHSKWALQAILCVTVLENCVSGGQTLTRLFYLTVLYFVVFFQVIE